MLSSIAFLLMFVMPIFAQEEGTTETTAQVAKFYSMALAVIGSSAAGGYAVAKVGTAACAAAAERPELAGRFLIYLGLAEGVCIYGVLVALIIWITV